MNDSPSVSRNARLIEMVEFSKVDELTGRMAGIVRLILIPNPRHAKPEGIVSDLAVNPEFQGKGIGTELMGALIEEARLRCYKLVADSRYDTPEDSRIHVHAMYQKLGFEDHGKSFRMDFPDPGTEA